MDIIVDRDNVKRIIIGKNGSRLKTVGTLARTEIESELANLKKEHSQELAGKASDTPAVVKGSVIRKIMKEIEGAIRFSISEFNTLEEMDEVAAKVSAAVKRFRRLGSFR